jgi:hypothetical protein
MLYYGRAGEGDEERARDTDVSSSRYTFFLQEMTTTRPTTRDDE